MRHWLIQRGRIRPDVKRSDVIGIDSLVRLDYMGAAEFEFGALPESLKKVCAKAASLKTFMVEGIRNFSGQRLVLVCTEAEKPDVEKFFAEELKTPHRLKEGTYFERVVKEKPDNWTQNFWWDIDNHWMAVFGQENADNVLLAIWKLKERKGW